jgi:hypothetical protein
VPDVPLPSIAVHDNSPLSRANNLSWVAWSGNVSGLAVAGTCLFARLGKRGFSQRHDEGHIAVIEDRPGQTDIEQPLAEPLPGGFRIVQRAREDEERQRRAARCRLDVNVLEPVPRQCGSQHQAAEFRRPFGGHGTADPRGDYVHTSYHQVRLEPRDTSQAGQPLAWQLPAREN